MGLFGKDKKEKLADAGYSEVGAIPVATPVAMTDDSAYGLMQQQQPINATLVQEPKLGKSSSPPDYIVKQQQMLQQVVPPQQQQQQQQHPHSPSTFDDNPSLSRNPMMMRQCPVCGQESRTRVTTYPVWQTWAASGVLCFVFWPIFWAPLVVDNCKVTDHHCVLCGGLVGKVDAFQDCCVTSRS